MPNIDWRYELFALMARQNFNDLHAFLAVARQQSFTRAAAQLGISQSALSHAMRNLEARLDIRLLNRTTRSVTPTDAGQHLLDTMGPHFDGIEAQIDTLSDDPEQPRGTVRINSSEHAIETVLWPKLSPLMHAYPDIDIELNADNSFANIVAERFDAGVRLGGQVADGMIAMRIGPDLSMAAVASPSYFERYGQPETPHDLTQHQCINMRFPTYGGLYAWEFAKGGQSLQVQVDGSLVLNSTRHIVEAATDGHGICYVITDRVAEHLQDGRLEQVLADWSPSFAGHHLYYPERRRNGSAFNKVLEALRHPESAA